MQEDELLRACCARCFDVLYGHFDGSKPGSFPSGLNFPLFVTWKRRGTLRGCIGTFQAKPLLEALYEYTLESALNDTRFVPIEEEEIKELTCSVSLLVDFEAAASHGDWTLGQHGIRISFVKNPHRYNSTFLPEVATTQGWSKGQTLDALIKKAGCLGSVPHESVAVQRFQSRRYSMTHDEYKAFKRTA